MIPRSQRRWRLHLMGSWTNLVEDLPPLCIATHFHATSRNQGSFSKQEREPWERGCELTCFSNLIPRVFSLSNMAAAAILEKEKTLGTRLVFFKIILWIVIGVQLIAGSCPSFSRNSVCFLLTAKVELIEKDISQKIPREFRYCIGLG